MDNTIKFQGSMLKDTIGAQYPRVLTSVQYPGPDGFKKAWQNLDCLMKR